MLRAARVIRQARRIRPYFGPGGLSFERIEAIELNLLIARIHVSTSRIWFLAKTGKDLPLFTQSHERIEIPLNARLIRKPSA